MPRQNMQHAAVDGTGSHPGQAASTDDEVQPVSQTHTTKPEQDICTHVRAWIWIAIGHPRPMAIIHLSLSLFSLRRRRQIDKDILRLCLLDQSSSHGECCCARGVVVYVCMPVTATATHWGEGSGGGGGGGWEEERTDEEPVQVANWHGSVQSIHRTSPHGGGNGRLHSVLPSPCRKMALLYLPLPSPHHHHHRREEKSPCPSGGPCISLEVGVVQTFYKFSAY